MALSEERTAVKFHPLKGDYARLQFIAKNKELLSAAKLVERLVAKYLEENKEWLAENMKEGNH